MNIKRLIDIVASSLALCLLAPLLIGVALVVVVLFYFRTKEMFKLLGFCLLLVVAFYLMTHLVGLVGSGSKYKDRMTHKTSEAIGE